MARDTDVAPITGAQVGVVFAALVLNLTGGFSTPARAQTGSGSVTYTVVETLLCGFDTSPASKELNRSKVFAPRGGHLAWVEFAKGNDLAVVHDGRRGPPFDDVKVGTLAFSPDGEHLGYVARQGKKTWFAVVDGNAGSPFEADDVGGCVFSADLRRVACGIRRGGRWHVLVDGEAGPAHKHVLERLFFSPDGRRLASIAQDEGARQLYLDGTPQSHWGNAANVIFSPDGARVASVNWEDRERQWRVIVDGKPDAIFASVYLGLTFSRDGRRIAYVAHDGKKDRVVIDGIPGPEFDEVVDVCFSPDGSQVAYVARNGTKTTVYVNGEALPDRGEVKMGSLTFNDADGHMAYQVQNAGKWQWIVGDVPGPLYDQLITMRLVFSPDGSHSAFAALEGGACFVVIDGQRSATSFGSLLTPPVFRPDGSLEYLAGRGTSYYRVRHVPKGS